MSKSSRDTQTRMEKSDLPKHMSSRERFEIFNADLERGELIGETHRGKIHTCHESNVSNIKNGSEVSPHVVEPEPDKHINGRTNIPNKNGC